MAHKAKKMHSTKQFKTATELVDFLQKIYGVPRKPTLKFSPRTLRRNKASGLYYPGTETIVLEHDELKSPNDVVVLFIEWLHHAAPAMHHEGE